MVQRRGWIAEGWRDYTAPRGVYYVTGNHDEFADRRLYIEAAKRTGVRVLNNENIVVDGLQIVGIHDTEVGKADEMRRILRTAELDVQLPGEEQRGSRYSLLAA